MSDSSKQPAQLDKSPLPNQLFLSALLIGVGLRVVAAYWGDIGVYDDGALRIAIAMRWAENPTWVGLSGVWPFTHIYILGALIRTWDQPVLLAKLVSLLCGVATIFAFRSAARHRFGPTAASLGALLLAVYWTHIWLTSSYWAEVPYLLFVLLATHFAERARATFKWKYALGCGLFLSLAILLRNEALMLMAVFTIWYLISVRKPRVVLAFVALPALLTAWYFIEPALNGNSYFDYFRYVAKSKEFENVVQNISRGGALYQWLLMLGASPTLLVVLPGLYGLWENRRRAITHLFAWMFVAQFGFYFSLTLASAWRPQLRYIMLQFINLFPYAALVWLKIMRRFRPSYVVAALLVSMIAIQSIAWWAGRNNRLPGGWLPLPVVTTPQKIIDEFVGRATLPNQQPIRIVSIVPGPRAERWSLEHGFVVNGLKSGSSSLTELDVHVQPEILSGALPPALENADVILVDPQAVFYSTVVTAINHQRGNREIRRLHPHIDAILLTDRAAPLLEHLP